MTPERLVELRELAATAFRASYPGWAEDVVAGLQDVLDALAEQSASLARMTAERDAVIDSCIAKTTRAPYRALVDTSRRGEMEHGFEWEVRTMGDFVKTKAEAVAAVRSAAGLDKRNSKPEAAPDAD